MLRIESYITPLILSYVDKYIKNLKPEDSQVSLWGGDAVFNNLDLRLDVLEQELSLPFSFVNGHIHELRIHVPWTKLTSEPIVITINTIECILKLRGTAAPPESETSSQQSNSNSSKIQDTRRKQKRQELEVPTSYVQSLINKIVNNIAIVCNNVILKYVEDDIVLSINVKTLEFKTVDEKWMPSFCDLSVENLILRNLATLIDLTVCLDKRNASGKIESYQEPLLYRCSLTCRVVRQYESANAIQPTIVRYDIFCPQLHFSFSDVQLPMFMRLIQLASALYYGHLPNENPHASQNEDSSQISGEVNEKTSNIFENEASDSWSSWAWSVGSSLLPIYWEEEEETIQSIYHHKLKRVLHFGIYVEVASWVFKLTESLQEGSFFGPSKFKFTPFLKLEQQGSFLNLVAQGMSAINVRVGISHLAVDPIGCCICGLADAEEISPETQEEPGVKLGSYALCGRESNAYLSYSLFDDEVLVSSRGELWNYNYVWDKHLMSVTETSLLEKTAAFGVDYLYMMDLPNADDLSSEKLSEINSNAENCNLNEQALCRLVFGPTELHISSGFFHRTSAIRVALEQYDYAPYYIESADEHIPTTESLPDETVEFLLSNCPIRYYSVSVFDPAIIFYTAQHPNLDIQNILNIKSRKRHQKASSDFCMARILAVPSIMIKASKVDASFSKPMYPRKVVLAASSMRPAPATLLKNCHSHFSLKFHNLGACLQNEEGWIVHLTQTGFSPSFSKKSLLFPLHWPSAHQPRDEYIIELTSIKMFLSMPHLLLLKYILSSWLSDMPRPEQLLTHSLVHDAIKATEKYSLLVLKLSTFEAKLCDTLSLQAGMASLGSLSLTLCKANLDIICSFLSGPEISGPISCDTNTNSTSAPDKLLTLSLQLPKDRGNESIPSIFTLRIRKFAFIVDPLLIEWLQYQPRTTEHRMLEGLVGFKKISQVKPLKKIRKPSECDGTISRNESSSMSVSETWTGSKLNVFTRQNTQAPVQVSMPLKERFVTLYPLINNLLIYVNIETPTIFLPTLSLSVTSESDLTNAVHRIYLTRSEKLNIGDTTVVHLPHILLQNAAQKQVLYNYIHDVPILLSTEAWSAEKEKLPWSLKLSNFNAYSLQGIGPNLKLPILKPANTTATIALTTKYQGPVMNQIGVVIHLDMSSLEFCGSKRQVEGHVVLAENLLNLASLLIEKMKIENCSEDFESLLKEEILPQKDLEGPKHSVSQAHVHKPSLSQPSPSQVLQESDAAGNSLREEEKKIQKQESSFQAPQQQTTSDDNPTTIQLTTECDENDHSNLKKARLAADAESCSPPSDSIIVTTWIQWTVARVSASLYAQDGAKKRKLTGELEDLTLSLDIHHIYSKLKCRMATLSLLHYIKSPSGWDPGEYEGVILSGGDQIPKDLKIVNPQTGACEASLKSNEETSSHEQPICPGFLSFTLTTALCQNVHSKWNQMVRRHLSEDRLIKENHTPCFLSEVDVRIQPFDIMCYPLALKEFTSIYEPWLAFHIPQTLIKTKETSASIPLGMNINNKLLPLVYLQTEAIRVFIPTSSSFTKDLNNHDVIMVQLASILISPQVDNPLSRIILRPDVYHAAEQARILGIPGSQVEDRQYQVDFLGFRVSTGTWKDLSNLKKKRARSASSELRGENPAFEWNNFDPSKCVNEPEAVFHPILTKMDTKIIAAPAIVYLNTQSFINNSDAVLVAGHSLEVNTTSDICIYASLAQIRLIRVIAEDMALLLSQWQQLANLKNSCSKSADVLDSGVDCDISSIEMSKSVLINKSTQDGIEKTAIDFVPLELLVTGSKITLSIYEKCIIGGQKVSLKSWQRNKLEKRARSRERKLALEVASTESELSPFKLQQTSSPGNLSYTKASQNENPISEGEDGYEGSEEESVYEAINPSEPLPRLIPLLFISLSQPHLFVQCQTHKQKVVVSFFDFSIRSVPKAFSIKGTDATKLPKAEDYTTSWIETKPGDPHPKTGIPPALLTLSAFDFLHKPAEITLDIGRPIRIICSKNKWDQVINVYERLFSIYIMFGVCSKTHTKPPKDPALDFSAENPPFQEKLRKDLHHFKRIQFTTNQIVINLETNKGEKSRSELHFSLSSLSLSLNMGQRKANNFSSHKSNAFSEISLKVEAKDLQLKTCYNSLGICPLLKPWSFGGEIRLLWLRWCAKPVFEIKLLSEIIEFHLGPENILCLYDIEKWVQKFMANHLSPNNPSRHSKSKSIEEERYPNLFFQDDLRAGVFQYVSYPKVSNKDIFPQPYQVVFDKTASIMVWCYPEPRALIRVDIFPVPFITASDISTTMDTQYVDEVTCLLQYYDPLREAFITYQKFQLSESQFCQLDLPGIHEKYQIAVSNTWRVWIDYIDDDFVVKDRMSVSPEALAACMRVDSLFSADLLPRAQAALIFRKTEATLINHLNMTGSKLPEPLSPFESDQTLPDEQPFITFSINNLCLRAYSWKASRYVETTGSLNILVLNYKFLTYNDLANIPNFQVGLTSQDELDNKPSFLDVQAKIKDAFVHINQSTVKTLISSKECWMQAFLLSNQFENKSFKLYKKNMSAVILTNYILCNNSTQSVRVGQVKTDENILLQSGGLHFYCWRSHKVPPRLQFCIESGQWKWSDPVDIDSEGKQVCTIALSVDKSCKFLVICQKIQSGQIKVSFEGLLSIANCLREDMEFKIIDKTIKEDSPKHSSVYPLKMRSLSQSFVGTPHGIKVRFQKSCGTWSGEVVLSDSSKDSLFVKIPLKSKGDCITIVCKIMRQRIGKVFKILILFMPHFAVRSHLPRSLSLFLATPSTKAIQKVHVKGRAHLQPLMCEGSSNHQITLQLSPDLEASKPPIPLTPSMIDQLRHSGNQEQPDLFELVENLFIDTESTWPYVDSDYLEGDSLFADQPKIDLQVDFSCLYPNCKSLVVDIRPWSLIVNHSGIELLLKEGQMMENLWYIPAGAVFAPPKLDNFFALGTSDDGEQAFCPILQLSNEERWYSLKFEGRIIREGETNLVIILKKKICFITVLSRFRENIQILHILPTYSITNNTNEALQLRSLYVHPTEEKTDAPSAKVFYELPSKSNSKDLKEVSLLFWDIYGNSASAVMEPFYTFQFIRQGFSSYPISLSDITMDCRVSFTLPCIDDKEMVNEPFLLTIHPSENRVKFVVQYDPSPQLIIHNNTTSLLVFGQSSLNEEGIMEEELDVFASLPSVPPFKAVFYTYPYISKKFPNVLQSSESYPRLHLSQSEIFENADNEEVLWSQGIDIHHHYDQFVTIPGFGDAKIHTERTGHTIHIFIDSASRIEVSAKDIRSRINMHPSKGRVATAFHKAKSLDLQHIAEEDADLSLSYDSNTSKSMTLPHAESNKDDIFASVTNPFEKNDSKVQPKNKHPLSLHYGSFLCSHLVIILKDDVTSYEYITEVLRISVENFIATFRPKIEPVERLRALGYSLREQTELTVFVGDAQLDNQLFTNGNFDFPVIAIRQDKKPPLLFSPFEPLERIIQTSFNNSLFSFTLLLEQYRGMACIHKLHVRVKPLTIFLEDSIIYALSTFVKSFIVDVLPKGASFAREDEDDEKSLLVMKLPYEIYCKSQAMTNPLHVNELIIDQISLLLSVHASIKIYVALDQTPLQFPSYYRSKLMTTGYALGHNITMHYLSSALFKAGWVVTSLAILGNPGGFARTVGSGIKDFVQLPYEGILQGPWAFVAGITHGSISLMKHLTAGTLESVTSMASSVARNMERLSMDEEHMLRSELFRRSRPSGLALGVAQGLSSFGISILGAIGGLFHQPLQAMMTQGVSPSSLVGGVSKGLVGVVAKPIGGAADLLVHTGQSLLQVGTGWKQDCKPRFKPLREPYLNVTNSPLKVTWKMLAALPKECRMATCSAEAMLVTSSGAFTPVTILLTPQVLFILGVEEDSHQHALPLDDLTWKIHPSDPTLLYLEKLSPPPKITNEDAEPISGCPERVADYVRSTCSEGVETGDLSSEEELFHPDGPSKDHLSRVKVHLSQEYRAFLVSALNISVRAIKGQGFIS